MSTLARGWAWLKNCVGNPVVVDTDEMYEALRGKVDDLESRVALLEAQQNALKGGLPGVRKRQPAGSPVGSA